MKIVRYAAAFRRVILPGQTERIPFQLRNTFVPDRIIIRDAAEIPMRVLGLEANGKNIIPEGQMVGENRPGLPACVFDARIYERIITFKRVEACAGSDLVLVVKNEGSCELTLSATVNGNAQES
jgi:hypothetical protein